LKKRLLVVALCVAFVMSAVACAPKPAPELKTFKIGGIAGLQTGFGRSMQTAADLAIEEINKAGGVAGYKLVSEWLDTEGSASTGRTVAQRLISGGANMILGCHASTVVLAIEDLMRDNKILEIAMGSMPGIAQLNNPFVIRVRENDALTAGIITEAVTETGGFTKVGIIHMSEQYGVGGMEAMTAALAAKGITPVVQSHNPNDADYSAQLLAFRRAGIEAMVIFSGAGDNGVILKQARQLIPDVEIFQSSVGATKPVLDVAGDAAVGAYAVVTYTPDNPDEKVQNFIKAYTAKYNQAPPDFFAPLAYDAVYMAAEALKAAGTHEGVAFKNAYRAIKDYAGATGLTYTVQENGDTVRELLLIKLLEGGKAEVVGRVSL
jgi:branched-chain amino acid transport system substrate-binding protein